MIGHGESNYKLLSELLYSVYDRVRSRFLHDGKLVPLGSVGAHRLGLAFLRDKSNPGYGWFKRVARKCLTRFLDRGQTGWHKDLHSFLAKKYMFRMKFKRSIVKGQVISRNDVYLQEWK